MPHAMFTLNTKFGQIYNSQNVWFYSNSSGYVECVSLAIHIKYFIEKNEDFV